MRYLVMMLSLLALANPLAAAEQAQKPQAEAETPKSTDKPARVVPRRWIQKFDEAGQKRLEGVGWRSDLPNYLVIGDSISIHMMGAIKKRLEGKANVFHCGGKWGINATSSGLTMRSGWLPRWMKFNDVKFNSLALMLGEEDAKKLSWAVISANWGMWDTMAMDGKTPATSLEDYRSNLDSFFADMKATGAEVLWVSTSPVPKGAARGRTDERVVQYNAVAAELAKKHGLDICDLYTALKGKVKPEWQKKNDPTEIHYQGPGREYCGEVVSQSVITLLERRAKTQQ